jgi:hypothetical protein
MRIYQAVVLEKRGRQSQRGQKPFKEIVMLLGLSVIIYRGNIH